MLIRKAGAGLMHCVRGRAGNSFPGGCLGGLALSIKGQPGCWVEAALKVLHPGRSQVVGAERVRMMAEGDGYRDAAFWAGVVSRLPAGV